MGGRDVCLWVDKWIPSLPVGHSLSRGGVAVSRNTRVEALMCTNNKSWDIDFLMAFLSSEEMNAIRDTMIGDNSKWDQLVWPFDKRGRYTVKLGYHWAHSMAHCFMGQSLSYIRHILEHVWKVIWKLNTPPKLWHFL